MKKLLSLLLLFLLVSNNLQAQIPSAPLKDLSGKTVDAATLQNDGKPFIISFFATWCNPCMRELTAISKVYPDWQRETGVRLYAVSVDQAMQQGKVGPLFQQKGFTFDVLLDTTSDFAKAYNVQSIPRLLLFDGNGQMVYDHSGYAPGDEEELFSEIKKIKNEIMK